MTSNRMLRALWITAAGACIALGAGHGVAAADADSSDGGAGPSASSQPSESSTSSSSAASSIAPKDPDKSQDSDASSKTADSKTADSKTADSAAADTPSSTVSAATVTVHRDDVASPERVEKVTAEPVKPAKHAESAEFAAPEPTAKVSSNVAANRSPAAPVVASAPARQPGPVATIVISLLSAFGLMPSVPAVPANVVGVDVPAVPGTSAFNGVTGVKIGSSNVQIPVGATTYTGAADWYFPTQADGTVQGQGVTWLQHGFLGSKSWYSALAQQLAQQTNSIVVVPNIPSFPFFTCSGCSLNDVPIQQGVAALFADPSRAALNLSAGAAGFEGTLPEKFTLTGHSAGGGLAVAAGGFYSDTVDPAANDLLGVVMYDGVSSNGTFAPAVARLAARNIPIYQIAAPPQAWNANGQTTKDLVALQPGRFVGATLANGSHVDSLIGGSPIIDFVSQLLIKQSPPGNTQAVYTLATGWINDLYAGKGPTDPLYGIYGDPDQYVVLGPTAAVVLGPAPVVDVTGTSAPVRGGQREAVLRGEVNSGELSTRNTATTLDGNAQTGQSVGQQYV